MATFKKKSDVEIQINRYLEVIETDDVNVFNKQVRELEAKGYSIFGSVKMVPLKNPDKEGVFYSVSMVKETHHGQ